MKAVKLETPRNIALVELEKPVPGPGEALIRIKTAGICASFSLSTKSIRSP